MNRIIRTLVLNTLMLCIISSVFLQCVGESPTVEPYPQTSGSSGTVTGTAAPHLIGSYPESSETDIPVDTQIILIFSEPIDLSSIVPGNVDISSGVTYSATQSADGRIIFLTITSGNLTPSTVYTVFVGTGVRDQDATPHNLITNYSFSFTTSADISAFVAPRVIAASRYPAQGSTGVSINQSFVDVTFSKPIDSATVIANTSYNINPGSATGVSTTDSRTFRLQLTTPLAYNTIYTISLTAAITDSLANPLVLDGNHTWTFTTELPPATGPLAISNVWVTDISKSAATIRWTTSTPQAAINVDYGPTSAYGSSAAEPAGTRTVHQASVTGLTRATKYYFRISYGVVSYTGSFITADDSATSDDKIISKTLNNTSLLTVVQNQTVSSVSPYYTLDGSSFVVWKNTDGTVYASFIDNDTAPTKRWGANGSAVDTNNRSVLQCFTDFMGACFVALGDGVNIYIKRIFNYAGVLTFDTVYGANAAAPGLSVSTGTNPALTILWGDLENNVSAEFVTRVAPSAGTTPNTTEMNIPWGSYFFDYDVDLSVAATGNHVIDGSYNHTTIDKTGQNYRHVIGTAANVVTATENYRIADHTTTTSFTATNHIVNTATAGTKTQTTYSNASTNAYTDHGDDLTGWGISDLITDGTNWGYVTANASEITLSTNLADTGTSDSELDFHLRNSLRDWVSTTPVYNYSLVKNTSTPAYSYVTNVTASDLTLFTNIFPNDSTLENYNIWNGVYCWTHVQDPPFSSFYSIEFLPSELISNGETVTLYNYVTGGIADTPCTNPLYDDGVNLGAVAIDDIVVNLSTYNYTRVNNIVYATSGALGLVGNIMSNAHSYWILRFINPAEPILVLGQSTSTSANQLVSTTKSAGFSGLVEKGDLVYNITDNTYAVVTDVNDNNTLTLNKDIITINDYFLIFASDEPLIETGTVTIAGNPFTDASANFISANGPVRVGDIVHNINTGTSAYVTAVNSATQLTLNNNIMTTLGHRYVIMQPRVLVAYERTGDIYGKVIRLRDGSTYLNEFTICGAAGTQANVQLITSGYTSTNTGAIALYRSGAGPTYTYYAKRINGAGVVNAADNVANGGLGVQVTPANAILLTSLSDDAGGMFVLYRIANDIYVSRITSAMVIAWTNTINNVIDAAMCRSGTGVIVTYNKTINSSQIFARGYTGAGGSSFGETTIVALTPWAYSSNLTIVPDRNNGAIISWIDERYLPQLGYIVMSQAINSAGVHQWDADSGVGTDFDGILVGFTSIWYNPYLGLRAVFYNDGAAPFGGIFFWYDQRNNLQDIYYDIKTY